MIKLQEKHNNNTKWTLRTTGVDDSLHLDLYLHQICFVSLLMCTAPYEKNQAGDKKGCDSSSFIYILIFLIQCCTHARNSKTHLKRGLTCLNYKKSVIIIPNRPCVLLELMIVCIQIYIYFKRNVLSPCSCVQHWMRKIRIEINDNVTHHLSLSYFFLIQCCTHARDSKKDLKKCLASLNYKKV